MREILRGARVNPATVYYYFGSKKGLMEAVLKRRFGPLRREHLEVLRQFEGEAKGQPLPMEKILEAMPLRLVAAPAAKRQTVTRLMGRIVTEPDKQTQEILHGQRSEVRAAFLNAHDGMMSETPKIGERLPSRPGVTKAPKGKKSFVPRASGLYVHPYTMAVSLGKQLRFSVPLEQVTAELDAVTQKPLPEELPPV
jgi:AcrR family transcriptional regulator